jgi:thiamine monophosphate synthase
MKNLYLQNSNNIPEQWFFCNILRKENFNTLLKLSKQTGVIFFFDTYLNPKIFLKKIMPMVHICKKKRIIFLIQNSFFLANKLKADGIFMNNKKIMCNMINAKIIKKRFLVATKVHNFKEAIKIKNKADMVFISNPFRTTSHPERKEMKIFYFISLCFYLKETLNFALGGVNKINFSRIKNKMLHGFGAISSFNKQK